MPVCYHVQCTKNDKSCDSCEGWLSNIHILFYVQIKLIQSMYAIFEYKFPMRMIHYQVKVYVLLEYFN